jgi:hypothetical protein
MKLRARFAGLLSLSVITLFCFTGCEWESGGDGYNSRYDWVDFSGVYRGVNGGYLLTAFSGTSGTPGTPGIPGTTNIFTRSQVVATTAGSQTKYSGVLSFRPVLSGSLTISTPFGTLIDDGSGGLGGAGAASGSINYSTGGWSIDFGGAPDVGQPLTANYRQIVVTPGSPGTLPGEPVVPASIPGGSRIEIFSFTVLQQGQNIQITDNNGSVYSGKLGRANVTDGSADAATVVVGTSIAMQFSANGVSAAGYQVKIVGTLQGVVSSLSGNQLQFADRRLFGTWIETGGKTGDINGQASPVTLTVIEGSGGATPATPTTPETPTE